MSLFSPLDPLLFVLYGAYKLRHVRGVILLFGLIPALLYSLPAQPCGCIRTPFVRCSSTGRESAYFAAMKSDLKNLASQQEIYYSDNDHYSVDVEALQFYTSYGVNMTLFASVDGWAARATHDALGETESCAIYMGEGLVQPIEGLEDASPGEIVCTK